MPKQKKSSKNSSIISPLPVQTGLIIFLTLIIILGAMSLLGVYLFSGGKARAGVTFSVSPATNNVDNLMGQNSATWEFTIDNTGETALAIGDAIRITFPDLESYGRTFMLGGSLSASIDAGADTLEISSSVPTMAPAEGEDNRTAVFVVNQAQTTPGSFTISLSGISANPIASLANLQSLLWQAQMGTLDDPENPTGSWTAYGAAVNSGGTTITRRGAMIPFNSDFNFSPSSYAAGATADYTLSFTAPTALAIGEKIAWQFPTEFTLTGATVELHEDINGTGTGAPQIAEGAIQIVTTDGRNMVYLTISNAPTQVNDVLTFTVKNIVNPIKGVYRGFGLYTTTSNKGVVDGLPNEASGGQEVSRKGPPLLESIMIGGTNTVNVTVKKENEAGSYVNLTADEAALVKVGMDCPDKMYFVGQKYVGSDSTATFENLLDCNYILFTEPAQDPGSGEADDEFIAFFETKVVPGMTEINALAGNTYSVTPTFLRPDTQITFTVTGGVPNSEYVFTNAFNGAHMAWAAIFQDTDYDYDKEGLNASGAGYGRLKVRSGYKWSVNLSLEQGNGVITDSSGNNYWAPNFNSVFIEAGDTSGVDLGSAAFVKADKTLNVILENSVTAEDITTACVSVSRSGGTLGMMMGGNAVCDSNATVGGHSVYQFKVPTGSLTIRVMKPGLGSAKEVPVVIKSTDTTVSKTIIMESPTSYISITVQDSDSNVISGASVYAQSSSGFGQCSTGSSGTCTIYVPEGTYRVEGFAPSMGQLTAQTGIQVTDEIDPSVTFTIALGDLKTISGRVFSDDVTVNTEYDSGETVYEGIRINAHSSSGGNSTVTLADGTYLLRLPAGSYTVNGWSETIGGLEEQTVDVSSSNKDNINWVVAEQGSLQVTVTGGASISSLSLGAINQSTDKGNFTESWTTSGSNKVATLTLPAGTYKYHVTSPAYGALTTEGGVDVTITADNTTTETVALPTSYTISGTVTGSGGIEGTTVWVANTSGPGYFSTTTDSDGAYSMTVKGGVTYDMGVNMTGYLTGKVTLDELGGNLGSQNFSLASSGTAITGTITNSSTAAVVTDGWVWAEKVGENKWTGNPIQANGTYSLDIDNGSWTVYADGPGYEQSSGLSVTSAGGYSDNDFTLTPTSGYSAPSPKVYSVTDTSGGTVSYDSDGDGTKDIEIIFPPKALGSDSANVTITMNDASGDVISTPSATAIKGAAYSIEASTSSGTVDRLSDLATVILTYNESDLPVGFNEEDLQIGYWDSNVKDWQQIAGTVDSTNNTITFKTDHLTDFDPLNPPGSVPDTPQGLAASASYTNVSLSWNSVSGATSYKVYRSTSEAGTYTNIGSSTSASYSDGTNTANTAFYYKVTAVNANGESSYSSVVSATTGNFAGRHSTTTTSTEEAAEELPTETVVGQATVTAAAGGSVEATTEEGSTVSVAIPAGAVTTNTTITATPVGQAESLTGNPPAGSFMVGNYVYNFTATSAGATVTTFGQNLTLTFTYTDAQVSGLDEASLTVYYWDSDTSTWVAVVSTVDSANNTVTAITNHFTYFTLMGEESEVGEGSLVQLAAGETIYLIQNSKKRLFVHNSIFESWGYSLDDVQIVSQEVLDQYPEGKAVMFKDGVVFRGTTKGLWKLAASAVYLVSDGFYRPIFSGDVYQGIFNDPTWSKVIWLPDEVLDQIFYPNGYPLGKLISSAESYQISLKGEVGEVAALDKIDFVKYLASMAIVLVLGVVGVVLALRIKKS